MRPGCFAMDPKLRKAQRRLGRLPELDALKTVPKQTEEKEKEDCEKM